MVNITKERYENNGIEVITYNRNTLWINEKDVQQQLGHKNLVEVTNKCSKEYRKCRYELIDEPIKQSHRKFIRNDLALKIIMDCRTDESCNLKRNLGFTLHDVINTKEQTVINSIKDALEGENIQTQYTALGFRIDKISKRLLQIEFASDHSIKSKYLKWIVKKYSLRYEKWLSIVKSVINTHVIHIQRK